MRLESNDHPTALLITGTVGAGKTSVAAAVGSILAEARIPHAVIDLDALSQSWPPPPGDPFNLAMELRNLDSLARNYLSAGACRLVVSGVVETTAARARYRAALASNCACVAFVPTSPRCIDVFGSDMRAPTQSCAGTLTGPDSSTRSLTSPRSTISRSPQTDGC
ncbi:hypothetical protein ACWCOV_32090 [Kribbella sp. NPDC002412]